MDDVMKSDNVGVLQVLEEGDLSDGRARSTFFVLQTNLLQSYQLVCDTGRVIKKKSNQSIKIIFTT